VAKVNSHQQLISGLVLCGGKAERMQGQDKGLLPLKHQTLAHWAIERLLPQVSQLAINANRNHPAYEAISRHFALQTGGQIPVYSDTYPGFVGPLGGFHTGLSHCQTEYLLVIPCDSPLFPSNLASELLQNLLAQQTDLAYAITAPIDYRPQAYPVFCLMRANLLTSLCAYLDQGERKIDRWFATQKNSAVLFPDVQAFANINTPAELAHTESLFA